MKKIKLFLIAIFVLLVVGSSLFLQQKIREKKNIAITIANFTHFCSKDIHENIFCSDTLPNYPIWIIFLNPECEMCEIEVKNIIEYQKELNHLSILIITNSEIEKIISFSNKYHLSNIPNLNILIDEELNQFEKYDINSIPTSFLYDKDMNLKIKHKGIISIQEILNFID